MENIEHGSLPEQVKDMVTELLDSEIIPKKEINYLKEEGCIFLDPNLVMDERHKEISNRKHKRTTSRENTSWSIKSREATKRVDMRETAVLNSAIKKLEEQLRKERQQMLDANRIDTERKEGAAKVVKRAKGKEIAKREVSKVREEEERRVKGKEVTKQEISKEEERGCLEKLRSLSLTPDGKSGYASSCDSGYIGSRSGYVSEERLNSESEIECESPLPYVRVLNYSRRGSPDLQGAQSVSTLHSENALETRSSISTDVQILNLSENGQVVQKFSEMNPCCVGQSMDPSNVSNLSLHNIEFHETRTTVSTEVQILNLSQNGRVVQECTENPLFGDPSINSCDVSNSSLHNLKFREKAERNETIEHEDQNREEKLNAFFLKLQQKMDESKGKMKKSLVKSEKKEAGKMSEKDQSEMKKKEVANQYGASFEKRFKAQKEIIERQKQELKERNKKIEELMKECREKKEKMESPQKCLKRDDLRKASVKRATREEHAPPAFLANMAKRAEERRRRRERLNEIVERKNEERQIRELIEKNKKEEERRAAEIQRQQLEHLKRLMEEENKRKEKERVGKAEQLLSNISCRMILSRAMERWKASLAEYKSDLRIAEDYHSVSLLKRYFNSWRLANKALRQQRMNQAEEFYKIKVKRKCLDAFKQNRRETVQMVQVADDYRDLSLVSKCFKSWIVFRQMEARRMKQLSAYAVRYHERKLKRNAFAALKEFPKIMFSKREEEKRLLKWAEKVKEVIPDFVIDYTASS